MFSSKVKKTSNLSKYKLYTKNLDPNDPIDARILENFRNIKHQEDERLRRKLDLKRESPQQQVIL